MGLPTFPILVVIVALAYSIIFRKQQTSQVCVLRNWRSGNQYGIVSNAIWHEHSYEVELEIRRCIASGEIIQVGIETDNDGSVWQYDVPPLQEERDEKMVSMEPPWCNNTAIISVAEFGPLLHSTGYKRLDIRIKKEDFFIGGAQVVFHVGIANKSKQYKLALEAKQDSERVDKMRLQRRVQDKQSRYKPLHTSLWSPILQSDWFAADLNQALSELNDTNFEPLVRLLQPIGAGVYQFPLFSQKFVDLLRDELVHAEQQRSVVNWTRPNTMNKHGFVLHELGATPWLEALAGEGGVLANVMRFGFGINRLDDAPYAFTIRYLANHDGNITDLDLRNDKRSSAPWLSGDEQLSRHMDLSQVTVNVCLEQSDDIEGGEVFFEGRRVENVFAAQGQLPIKFRVRKQIPGYALMHIGQHWHGATPIKRGTRTNLVIWGRSKEFGNSPEESYNGFSC